jgi:hypothetical protein
VVSAADPLRSIISVFWTGLFNQTFVIKISRNVKEKLSLRLNNLALCHEKISIIDCLNPRPFVFGYNWCLVII